MNNYYSNKSMDLHEVTANVLKNWKKIPLLVIVLVLMLSAYSFKKEKSAVNSQSIASTSASLTDTQKETVENVFLQYQYYYSQNKNYIKKSTSLLNTLNPYHTPSVTLSFVANTNIINLSSFFQDLDLTDEQENQLTSLLNLDGETSAEDLIYTGDLDNNNSTDNSSATIVTSEEANNIAMNIQLVGVSEQNSNAAADILVDAINNKINWLIQSGYSISISEITRNYSESYSKAVADFQASFSENFEKIKTQLSSLKTPSALTDEENTYYQALVRNYMNPESANAKTSISAIKIIKNIMLSILLGIIIGYFVEAIKYQKSHTVKIVDDLVLAGADPVFTKYISGEEDSSKFTRKIRKLSGAASTPNAEAIQLATAEIMKIMEKNNFHRLYICYDANDQETKKVLNALSAQFKNKLLILSGSPLTSSKSFDEFAESESVLFLKTAYVSSDNTLLKEIDMAKRNNVNIVGSLLVKNIKI